MKSLFAIILILFSSCLLAAEPENKPDFVGFYDLSVKGRLYQANLVSGSPFDAVHSVTKDSFSNFYDAKEAHIVLLAAIKQYGAPSVDGANCKPDSLCWLYTPYDSSHDGSFTTAYLMASSFKVDEKGRVIESSIRHLRTAFDAEAETYSFEYQFFVDWQLMKPVYPDSNRVKEMQFQYK